jgi:uncharacterized lipoprotein YmbA
MKTPSCWISPVLIAAAAVCLGGCLDLKPVRVGTRYFVLSTVPATDASSAKTSASPPVTVGIGPVKLPPYLLKSFFAVRKNANEIDYLETALWAEGVDQGFLRVLGADLSSRLGTDQIRLSAWQKEDVAMEVYVTLEQFDVDTAGQAVLTAWWRILSPGGEHILKAGQFHAARQGPHPGVDPQGAAATLSQMIGDFSGEMARTIQSLPAETRRAVDR